MSKRPKRKSNGAAAPSRAEQIEHERRRALQRAVREQKRIRALVGQLRRSRSATDRSLLELRDELTSKFSGALGGARGGDGDEA